MAMIRMRQNLFGNSGGSGFNVSFVDRVSTFLESVFETSKTDSRNIDALIHSSRDSIRKARESFLKGFSENIGTSRYE